MMGTGEAEGEDRAIQAAEAAIANPLLDEISLRGAKGVLINITGGHDITLFELDEAANRIREEVDPDANIIVGSTMDTGLDGKMRVSVVATGIDASEAAVEAQIQRRSLKEPLPQEVKEPEAAAQPEPATPVVAAAPAVAAAATATTQPAEEPSLFENMQPQQPASASGDLADQIQAERQAMMDDDLPPPAYAPTVPQFQPRAESIEATPEAVEEVAQAAPAPRAPGTPTPEALARLRAATQRAAPQPAAAPQVAEAPAEKPRFGINSLINRMTGSPSEGAVQQAAPSRQQPPVQTRSVAPAPAPQSHQAPEPDSDRIEIPAFLRRQAN
jgi:cell division protein FtsZ